MMRSDYVFSQQPPSCSNPSRRGRYPQHQEKHWWAPSQVKNNGVGSDDGVDQDDDHDDDDESMNLEDLILGDGSNGGNANAAPCSSEKTHDRSGDDDHDDDGEEDEDSSIESSLHDDGDEHADDDDDLDDDDSEGGDEDGNIRRGQSSTIEGVIQDALLLPDVDIVEELSRFKIRHHLGDPRGEKKLNLPPLSSMTTCCLNDENNESSINDGISMFDISSSCLSYDYEEDVKGGFHDPHAKCSKALRESTTGQKRVGGLPPPVRFSAGTNLHRHQSRASSSTSGGGVASRRTMALHMSPMCRITEHTRESAYNSSDFDDVSTSCEKANSNCRGGCGRSSSITTSCNNSFAEDASSKVSSVRSTRRFDAFSPSPKCGTGGGTWVTMKRCDILNIQDLQSLMLSMDD